MPDAVAARELSEDPFDEQRVLHSVIAGFSWRKQYCNSLLIIGTRRCFSTGKSPERRHPLEKVQKIRK